MEEKAKYLNYSIFNWKKITALPRLVVSARASIVTSASNMRYSASQREDALLSMASYYCWMTDWERSKICKLYRKENMQVSLYRKEMQIWKTQRVIFRALLTEDLSSEMREMSWSKSVCTEKKCKSERIREWSSEPYWVMTWVLRWETWAEASQSVQKRNANMKDSESDLQSLTDWRLEFWDERDELKQVSLYRKEMQIWENQRVIVRALLSDDFSLWLVE